MLFPFIPLIHPLWTSQLPLLRTPMRLCFSAVVPGKSDHNGRTWSKADLPRDQESCRFCIMAQQVLSWHTWGLEKVWCHHNLYPLFSLLNYSLMSWKKWHRSSFPFLIRLLNIMPWYIESLEQPRFQENPCLQFPKRIFLSSLLSVPRTLSSDPYGFKFSVRASGGLLWSENTPGEVFRF